MSDVPRKRTVGSLDMGGGSAQIAFEVAKSVSTDMYEESEMLLMLEVCLLADQCSLSLMSGLIFWIALKE